MASTNTKWPQAPLGRQPAGPRGPLPRHHSPLTFGLLLALGLALLGDLAGLLARGVRVGPQRVGAGHAAARAVAPCALVVAARCNMPTCGHR